MVRLRGSVALNTFGRRQCIFCGQAEVIVRVGLGAASRLESAVESMEGVVFPMRAHTEGAGCRDDGIFFGLGGESSISSRGVRWWRRGPRVSGQDGNPDHRTDAAMGAAVDLLFSNCFQHLTAIGWLRQQLCNGNDQQLAAERQFGCPVAVGKEAEVTDALKTCRQRMDEKRPDELIGVNRHDLRVLSVFVFIVLPLERAPAVFV